MVQEVRDSDLVNFPATAIDVFVTNNAMNGKTLRELADKPFARGIYIRQITRNLVEIPILPETEILRGDILTIAGNTRHVEPLSRLWGMRIERWKRRIS